MDTKMKDRALWSLLTPQRLKWTAITHLGKCVILGESHSPFKGHEKQSNAWPLQVQYHGPWANSPQKHQKRNRSYAELIDCSFSCPLSLSPTPTKGQALNCDDSCSKGQSGVVSTGGHFCGGLLWFQTATFPTAIILADTWDTLVILRKFSKPKSQVCFVSFFSGGDWT